MNREKPETGSSISLQERSCYCHCLFIQLFEICARGKREAICQSRSQLTETIDPPFYCAGKVPLRLSSYGRASAGYDLAVTRAATCRAITDFSPKRRFPVFEARQRSQVTGLPRQRNCRQY